MFLRALGTFIVSFFWGCAQTPGTQVGEFDVTQNLLENTCGAAALPAPDPLVYRAELREDEQRAYWRYETRDRYISGSLSNGKLNFALQTSMEQPIELSDGSTVTCRLNQLESLELSSTDEMQMLSGSNKILLAPANSECSYLSQSLGGPFLALPCEVSYEVVALRITDQDSASAQEDAASESGAAHRDGGLPEAGVMDTDAATSS